MKLKEKKTQNYFSTEITEHRVWLRFWVFRLAHWRVYLKLCGQRGNPTHSVDLSVVGGVYVGPTKTVGENSWEASSSLS